MENHSPASSGGIAGFALRNPHFVVVICLLVTLLGSLALLLLPKDLLPASKLPAVQILSFYPGMPVKYVENDLTAPYELYTGQAIGIEHQESRSLEGVSIVKNYFGPGTDLNTAIAQVTSLSLSVLRKLPPGTQPPLILPFDPMASVPLALVAVSTERHPHQLYDMAYYQVRDAAQAIPGAIAPTVMGGAMREILIYTDPEKMRQFNLSPLSVMDTIGHLNTIVPSGDVKIGDFDRQILSNGLVEHVEDMNDFPLRMQNGTPVFVKDIGDAQDSHAIQTNMVTVNGQPEVYVPIYRQPGANSLEIVDNVRQTLTTLRKRYTDFAFTLVADQSIFVRHAIHSIAEETIIGGGLAALLVLLFLGNPRATLGVCLSIPLALLCAFLGLKAVGETVNAMTLGGLALSIGVLVDNSIVVLENISQKLGAGIAADVAALEGATEVSMPVLSSTLATLVVFFPVMFLQGIVKILFSSLAKAVMFAMIGSYFAAMAVMPLFAAHVLHPRAKGERLGGLFGFLERRVEKLTEYYGRALTTALRHRGLILGGVGVLLLSGGFLATRLGTELFPRADAGNFVMQVRLASGTRIEKTHEFASQLDGRIHEWVPQHDLALTISNEGVYYGFPAAYTPNAGTQDMFFIVELTENRRHTSQYYAQLIRQKMAQEFPNAEVNFQLGGLLTSALNAGLPAPIDIQIQGPDTDTAHQFAQQMVERIRSLPGAVDVHIQQRVDSPAYQMNVDRDKAATVGLTVEEVVKNVVSAVSGSSTYNPAIWVDPKSGIDYALGVQFNLKLFNKLSDILSIPITGHDQTRSIPLGRLAKITDTQVPTEVDHVNLERVIDVYLTAQGRDIGSLSKDVEHAIGSLPAPAGYTWKIRGEISQMRRAVSSLGGGFVLAAILVYLILVVQFRSFIVPVIMMVSVPLGLVGVIGMLFITHTYFSIQAAIGAIFMIGIAVANGVLIIEFIEHHFRQGAHLEEAIVKGAQARLRPILMTSLASILGLVPMALGFGHGSEANIPLGRAVIGGQLLSTSLTLFVVPILFDIVSRYRSRHGEKALVLFLLMGVFCATVSSAEEPHDLTIPQAIHMAEAASPDLQAAMQREKAADQNIRLLKSFYYPTVTAQAIDSFGFPASNRDLGIGGIMGSPYRSGAAGGLTADLDLINFGRGEAVQAAKEELEAVRARTRTVRYQADQRVLEIFLDASRYRGQAFDSGALASDSKRIEQEVNHFVKTGQRSVVEKLLVHDQTSDADMTSAAFAARYQIALERLAVVTASSATVISCPLPDTLEEVSLGLESHGQQSPIEMEALAQAAAAHAAIAQFSSENYPRLMATASVGGMENVRLVQRKDYSGGFGVQWPLFEGFRVRAAVQQAQALASARDEDQMAVRMEVDQLNARYDGIIQASRVQLSYLKIEIEDAQKALKLAQDRYLDFEGTLVDTREALRNLDRIETEQVDVKMDLLLAAGSKALLNGATPR